MLQGRTETIQKMRQLKIVLYKSEVKNYFDSLKMSAIQNDPKETYNAHDITTSMGNGPTATKDRNKI